MSSETEAEAELAGARHKLENGLDTHVALRVALMGSSAIPPRKR